MLILSSKDWLYKTIPYFRIQNWVVQTLGTSKPQLFGINKIQAFALDAHFTLEQVGRNSNCISSILMEPLACGESNVFWMRELGRCYGRLGFELSRSVKSSNILKMWLPAELPAIISATRSQQFRWNKGGAENFSKNAARTIKVYWIENKSHGMFHLLNSTMFLAIFTMAVFVPMLYIKNEFAIFEKYLTNLFVITSILFFYFGRLSKYSWSFKNFLTYITIYYLLYHSNGFHFII
jgi:hypothetical protein